MSTHPGPTSADAGALPNWLPVCDRLNRYHRRRWLLLMLWMICAIGMVILMSGWMGQLGYLVRHRLGGIPSDYAEDMATRYPAVALIGTPLSSSVGWGGEWIGIAGEVFLSLVICAAYAGAAVMFVAVVARDLERHQSGLSAQRMACALPMGGVVYLVLACLVYMMYVLGISLSLSPLRDVAVGSGWILGFPLAILWVSILWLVARGMWPGWEGGLLRAVRAVESILVWATLAGSPLLVWLVWRGQRSGWLISWSQEGLLRWLVTFDLTLSWGLSCLLWLVFRWPAVRAQLTLPCCSHCGYDLTGTRAAGRTNCPECGTAIGAPGGTMPRRS